MFHSALFYTMRDTEQAHPALTAVCLRPVGQNVSPQGQAQLDEARWRPVSGRFACQPHTPAPAGLSCGHPETSVCKGLCKQFIPTGTSRRVCVRPLSCCGRVDVQCGDSIPPEWVRPRAGTGQECAFTCLCLRSGGFWGPSRTAQRIPGHKGASGELWFVPVKYRKQTFTS